MKNNATNLKVIQKELSVFEKSILTRAKENNFSGKEEELFDIEINSEELSYWDWNVRENHAFDLGAYHSLKNIEQLFSNEKDELINKIKKIITEIGEQTTSDMELKASPFILGTKNHYLLVEHFNLNTVTAVLYNNSNKIDESEILYSKLNIELLTKIHSVLLTFYNSELWKE